MMTQTTTSPEAEIRALLDDHAAAYAARDADRMLAPYADDAVRYTLAPPLQQQRGDTSDIGGGGQVDMTTAAGIRAWLTGFDGPVEVFYLDPVVTADGSVAFVHALTRMTATPAGADEPFSLWFRSTYGLRRIDGTWRITHEHASTPFHMDGSFRAATNLQP